MNMQNGRVSLEGFHREYQHYKEDKSHKVRTTETYRFELTVFQGTQMLMTVKELNYFSF